MGVTFHNLKIGILPPNQAIPGWRFLSWAAPDPQIGHPEFSIQYEAAVTLIGWNSTSPPGGPPIHGDVGFSNVWAWGAMPRRDGLGHGFFKQRDMLFGGDGGSPGFEVGYDVKIMWVADPVPGVPCLGQFEMHYHVHYDGGNSCYEIRLWKPLGQGFGVAPPYQTLGYMQECIHNGLAEVMTYVIDENYGAGTSQANAAAIFGGGNYDTGRKRGRTQYAVAETLKELLFSGRETDSRASHKLQPVLYRRFCDDFISKPYFMEGPGDVIYDGASGLADNYTVPTSAWAWPPPPYWVPFDDAGDYQGPADYDYPLNGGSFATFNRQIGGGWYWTDGRRAPKPGSKVKFKIAWWPVTPMPTHGPATYQLQTGSTGTENPDIPFSGPRGVGFFGLPGIVWGIDLRPNDTKFEQYAWPEEIEFGNPPFPVLNFNFAAPGEWEFSFTVPQHTGSLAIGWVWDFAWFFAKLSGQDITGDYPIRCEPGIPRWTRYPEKVKAVPYVPPVAYINAGDPAIGEHPVQRLVVGTIDDAITMLDPYAAGYHIEIDNRDSGNRPPGHAVEN